MFRSPPRAGTARRRRRERLLAGVGGLAAALLATAALGQQDDQEADETVTERVVVTGTRIEQTDFAFSNPVMSLDADNVRLSGQTNLTDLLTEVPALAGSTDSFDTGGSNADVGTAGLNLLDLRFLGTERTLVLVNGRRHVASLAETASVDIANIPIDLVERIDVLTGGASAVYGADGVTGVVNFVLQDDFEGLHVRGQTGQPNDTGAEAHFLGVILGQNFDQARGNVTLAAEYSYDGRLYGRDRDFNGGRPGILTRFEQNPADTADPPAGDGDADDPAIPDNIPLELTAFGDSARCGAIYASFSNGPSPDFDCFGNPWNFGPLPPQIVGGAQDFPVLPFFQVDGSATLRDDYVAFSTILPEIERLALNAFAHYELSPMVRVFAELEHVESDVWNESQPSFDFFLFIDPANPFIPPALQAEALANEGLFMSRDHFDMGIRADDITRKTDRGVIGVDGDLADWVRYEASFVYGKTKVSARQVNNRFNDRFFAALDVVDNGGVPDCRVNVDPSAPLLDASTGEPIAAITFTPGDGSCVPLNLFGEGSPSPAAIDWIMNTTIARDTIEQTVVSGYFSGTLDPWLELPAGSLGWSLGAEYRDESSKSLPDPFDTLGATFGNVVVPNAGDFDVWELFTELDVPILAERPFAEELSFEAAYRFSDYSTIGETNTWKVGGVWSPVLDVAFRATYAEAVRAPNIAELFGAENQTFEFITDPCDVTQLPLGTSFRAANCAAIFAALNPAIIPGQFTDPNSATVAGVLTGNPDLQEETASTTTVGVVFRPRFLEGLTFSIDYYDIELTEAIAFIDPQATAERCVDAPTPDPTFCDQITRNPDTGGIDAFRIVPVNLQELTTAGYDFSLAYTFEAEDFGADVDWGVFTVRLIGNKLDELNFLPSPGGVPDDDVREGPSVSFSEQPVPEWQASFDLTWDKGSWTVNYGFQWFDETSRISNRNRKGDADLPAGNTDFIAVEFWDFDSRLTHDIQVQAELNQSLSVYGGINNFTDEEPAFDEIFHPVSPVGRFFYVGLEADLRDLGGLIPGFY